MEISYRINYWRLFSSSNLVEISYEHTRVKGSGNNALIAVPAGKLGSEHDIALSLDQHAA